MKCGEKDCPCLRWRAFNYDRRRPPTCVPSSVRQLHNNCIPFLPCKVSCCGDVCSADIKFWSKSLSDTTHLLVPICLHLLSPSYASHSTVWMDSVQKGSPSYLTFDKSRHPSFRCLRLTVPNHLATEACDNAKEAAYTMLQIASAPLTSSQSIS
ncbi:hypothetical protein FA95DRAFT_1369353 [Auriscalpium vulgare]|uniref:Uncharacterized protein n=1 Tax=Auriscalpium vulgare TaxID=40419 RepID=A0ACB8RR61_9AGAM|nr:hypothetical protein FA95DRAFT_1369353 [Auriscalpium vulgare]